MTLDRTFALSIAAAGIGAALLSGSSSLAFVLLRPTAFTDYSDAYVVVSPWLLVFVLAGSALVVLTFIRARLPSSRQGRPARRFALIAMLITTAAWVVGVVSWLVANA